MTGHRGRHDLRRAYTCKAAIEAEKADASDTPEPIRQHGLQGQVWPITNHVLDSVQADTDSMESFRSSLKSSSILPVPRTTQHRGSSAIETGSPVSFEIGNDPLFQRPNCNYVARCTAQHFLGLSS